MMAIRTFCLVLCFLFSKGAVGLSPPAKFEGKWQIKIEDNGTYPWWTHVKYPVELLVSENGGYFLDQSGMKCPVESYFYDADEDMIVLMHCGALKSPNVVRPFFLISLKGDKLIGEVRTYKPLFVFNGEKVE